MLLTVAEAADELRVSVRAMYDLISAGRVPSCDVGTGTRARTRISRDALTKYVESTTTTRPVREQVPA